MLYRFLKIIVGIGIRLYYREIKVKNREYLENDGPMIIIANHPNTLMDAWIIGQTCKQPIYFMAKGTFFNTGFKRAILNSLNMIPINRTIDKKTEGVNNDNSFEACYKVLEAGKTLVIFPEGNSMMERQLRELKTGTARIALEVESRNDGDLKLKVVPMGLFYSKAEKFRSSVLINIEQGLYVTEFLEEYKENHSNAAKKLTAKFRTHLERVLVTTDSLEQEKLLEDIFEILKNLKDVRDVEDNVALMKKVKERIEELQLVQPYLLDEIQNVVNSIHWQREKLQIKAEFVNKRFRSNRYLIQMSLSVIFTLLGLPMFLFGFIHNIVPFKLTAILMSRLIKNIEYYAPIAVLIGLVLYPLNYFLLLSLATDIFDLSTWGRVLYFTAMPVCGLFAFHFSQYLSTTAYKWKYIFLVFDEKTALRELRVLQEKLNKLILED